jgi:hypothetical protein
MKEEDPDKGTLEVKSLKGGNPTGWTGRKGKKWKMELEDLTADGPFSLGGRDCIWIKIKAADNMPREGGTHSMMFMITKYEAENLRRFLLAAIRDQEAIAEEYLRSIPDAEHIAKAE